MTSDNNVEIVVVIGTTTPTKAGYALRVSIVRMPEGGTRVRLTLVHRQKDARQIDIGSKLLEEALPLLHKAATTPPGEWR